MSRLSQILQYSDSFTPSAKDKFGCFTKTYNSVFCRWMDESLVQEFADILSATYLVFKQTENIEQIENKKIFGKVCKEMGVKQLNGRWMTCDPSLSNSQSFQSFADAGFDVADERDKYEEPANQFEALAGVIADPKNFASRTRKGIRNAQLQIKRQTESLVAYHAGSADVHGQLGLFGLGV
ncbi:hypothetical protein [Sulfuriferula thiophila]|uniref:hypothetical protein n=1 Tax=Sulfuriferula thiophila TaxID=1781211 RepID=UPI000F614300|nr:hypothetical protein [Sulfuriferula thiophila]